MTPHALDTAAFRFFASACAAAVRNVPAPDLPSGVDPEDLIALATRHRIAAPVLDRLARATQGAASAARLEASARHQRLAALHRTQRLVLLSRALTASGVRHLVVKGSALAVQLYDDVAARDSKDIDLLVDPTQFDAAVPVIVALGYALVDDYGALDTDAGEHAPKHRTFRCGDIEVEVHTRLLDMADFIPLPFDAVWGARVAVSLGGVEVQAMSPVDTLLYLCAHGTEHCWFRLKWLQDIARISFIYDKDTLSRARSIARDGGYDRILDAALLLVEQLFGIAAAERPHTDRATRRLVDLSYDALAAPAELASEPTLRWLLRRSTAQIAYRHTWHDRIAFVRHLFTSPRSFDTMPRPASDWRTYLGRPFRLLGAHYARRRARR